MGSDHFYLNFNFNFNFNNNLVQQLRDAELVERGGAVADEQRLEHRQMPERLLERDGGGVIEHDEVHTVHLAPHRIEVDEPADVHLLAILACRFLPGTAVERLPGRDGVVDHRHVRRARSQPTLAHRKRNRDIVDERADERGERLLPEADELALALEHCIRDAAAEQSHHGERVRERQLGVLEERRVQRGSPPVAARCAAQPEVLAMERVLVGDATALRARSSAAARLTGSGDGASRRRAVMHPPHDDGAHDLHVRQVEHVVVPRAQLIEASPVADVAAVAPRTAAVKSIGEGVGWQPSR